LSLTISLIVAGVLSLGAQPQTPSDEQVVRATIARFYEGWNEHNADKIVSVYAERERSIGKNRSLAENAPSNPAMNLSPQALAPPQVASKMTTTHAIAFAGGAGYRQTVSPTVADRFRKRDAPF